MKGAVPIFNGAVFNQSPFNQILSLEVYISAALAGEGALSAKLQAEIAAKITMSGESDLAASYIREITNQALMQGEGALTAQLFRDLLYSALLEGEGQLKAFPRKFHVESIIVTGPFLPGDKVVIDAAKMRVTKNGNMIGYDGDIFELSPGSNVMLYTDSASSRTVLIRTTYRDRFN